MFVSFRSESFTRLAGEEVSNLQIVFELFTKFKMSSLMDKCLRSLLLVFELELLLLLAKIDWPAVAAD
jgi:hypothetical protein